jgi:hypothetical protein
VADDLMEDGGGVMVGTRVDEWMGEWVVDGWMGGGWVVVVVGRSGGRGPGPQLPQNPQIGLMIAKTFFLA